MSRDRSTLSRRGLLRGIGGATVGGVLSASASPTSGRVHRYLTLLEEGAFYGFDALSSTGPGSDHWIATTDVEVPDLSVTPHAVESVSLSGIAHPEGPDQAPASAFDGAVVETGDLADRTPPGSGDVVGYRLVGDLTWERDVAVPETGDPIVDFFTPDTGPAPTHVDYALRSLSESLAGEDDVVDHSRGCPETGTEYYAWGRARHRVVTWIDPDDDYLLEVFSSRGSVPWTFEGEIQVVTDEARPRFGNDNGFHHDEEAFEEHKPTSMADLDGYHVRLYTGTNRDVPYTIELQESPYYPRDLRPGRCRSYSRPVEVFSGTSYLHANVPPSAYRLRVRPPTDQAGWRVRYRIFKRVVPDGN